MRMQTRTQPNTHKGTHIPKYTQTHINTLIHTHKQAHIETHTHKLTDARKDPKMSHKHTNIQESHTQRETLQCCRELDYSH